MPSNAEVILTVIVLLVVAALVGAAVWWFAFHESPPAPPAATMIPTVDTAPPNVVSPAKQRSIDTSWFPLLQTVPENGVAAGYTVKILNDVSEVETPEAHNFPDGVSICVPSANNQKWILIQPEQINYRAVGSSPLYEDNPISSYKPIRSLGVAGAALIWPGLGKEMAVWLFSLLKVPTESGLYLGFLHAELHPIQKAPPCFKALMRCESRDEGLTFSAPEVIISFPTYSPKFDGEWGGTGDPSFVYHEAGKRWLAYFYSRNNGDGCGIACSTDEKARAGTWKLLDENGTFTIDALSNKPYTTLKISGGNPHVLWNKHLGKFFMIVGEWQEDKAITLSTSLDGVKWDAKKVIPFDCKKGSTPLYPSVVNAIGGSLFIEGTTSRLYYADSRGPR